MNEIDPIVTTLGAVWDRITSAPIHLLLILALSVLGFMLKKAPFIRNDFIPWILILVGTFGYPFLTSPGTVNPTLKHPSVVLGVYGFLLGFAAWVLHASFLKRLEKYLPGYVPPAGAAILIGFLFTGCVIEKNSHGFRVGTITPPAESLVHASVSSIGVIVGQNYATQNPEVTIGYKRGVYHRIPTSTNEVHVAPFSSTMNVDGGLKVGISENTASGSAAGPPK